MIKVVSTLTADGYKHEFTLAATVKQNLYPLDAVKIRDVLRENWGYYANDTMNFQYNSRSYSIFYQLKCRETALQNAYEGLAVFRETGFLSRLPNVQRFLPPVSAFVAPPYNFYSLIADSDDPIAAVGLEIEGGWNGSRLAIQDKKGFLVARDTSVNCGGETLGEVRCGPYARGVFDAREIAERYPQYVDSSCGLHVHLSFPNIGIYNVFARREFYNWFLAGLLKWGSDYGIPNDSFFWKRFQNYSHDADSYNNHFCAYGYDPNNVNAQMHAQGNRYNAINYCYTAHRTIEVRVLCAFSAVKDCLAAASEVVRLFRLWGSRFTIPETILERNVNTKKEIN